MKRTAVGVGLVNAAVVDAVRIGSNEGVIAVIDHGDGKPAGDMSNAGDGPASGEAAGLEELIEGQLVLVADDEVVFHIESGEAVAQRRVEGIDLFADVGRLVE